MCSDAPGAGDWISCTETRFSRDDIDINLRNPSISTTATFTDAIYAQHSGDPGADKSTATGDINVRVTGGSLTAAGRVSYGILATLRLGGGDVSVNLENVAIEATGERGNGVRGRMYNLGDINITISGGSVTTGGDRGHAVISYHDGNGQNDIVGVNNASSVTTIVKNAAIKTAGDGSWGVVGYVRPENAGTIPVSITIEGGSVETAGAAAHAVSGFHRGWSSWPSYGDVGIVAKDAAIKTVGDGAHAVLGNHAAEHPEATGGVSIDVQGGSLTAEGLSARGAMGMNSNLGSVSLTMAAAVKSPFFIGAEGRLTNDENAEGRLLVTNAGTIEARDVGVHAWAARSSGSTFGEGTRTADDAARTEPMVHVVSSGDITVGAGVTDDFIRNKIAGDDGTLSTGEQSVLSAVEAGDSDALDTALDALPADYDDDWKAEARNLLRKRGWAPTDASPLAHEAAGEILEIPRAGIRALALSHAAIADYVREGDRDPAILAIDEASRTTQQKATLAAQALLSAAERTVLEAALTGGDLEAALAALPAAYADDWKNEVRRLAASYNAGNIRVDVTGGTITAGGDGVHARYVLEHDGNGAIMVNVAEGAEIAGERAGVFVSGAGLGRLGRDDPTGLALGLTEDEEELRRQFVTVRGRVRGGADAAVHLSGGGTLLVDETGEVLAGASGRAILVNDPGRAIIVVRGTVRGGEGAPAAVHLTGGGMVTIGLNGRVEANGAEMAIRGDAPTTIVVHAASVGPRGVNEAGSRLKGAIGGEGVGASVTFAEVDPETGLTTGNAFEVPLGAGGALDFPDIPAPPAPMPAPTRFDCGLAEDRRCELYEALPSLLLAVSRTPAFSGRHGLPEGSRGVWGRVETSRGEWTADRADSAKPLAYDYDVAGARAGVGFEAGAWPRAGFSVHMLRARAKMSGAGEIVLNGVGAGVSAAWRSGGYHVDVQARATSLDADIDSAASGKLENEATGRGLAAGFEVGRRMSPAGGALTVTPRLGFAWARASLGGFTDSVGDPAARVSVRDAKSLRGRLGVTIERPMASGGLFAALDLEREFSDETSARVSDAKLETKPPSTAFTLDVGGAFEMREGVTLRLSGRYAASGSGTKEYGAAVSLSAQF